MHILNAQSPIDLGNAGTIKAGRYLVEDLNAAELLVMAEAGTAKLEPFDMGMFNWRNTLPSPAWAGSCFRDFDEFKDWNGKSVLFMRSGGYGDMLFLGPILREMRRRWPAVLLTVACRKERFEVFRGLDYPNGWLPTPVTVETAATFDAVVSFEHVIERQRTLHYVDALAEHMGLVIEGGVEARRIEYRVGIGERAVAALKCYQQKGVKRLGIQVMSGARYRSYPRNQSGQVAMHFLSKGWEVYLFGVKGDVQEAGKVKGLRDLTNHGLSFRDSCAILSRCGVFLGPDSALTIVSGALNIPTIALFGPIDSQLRTKYAPSVTAIDGKGVCAPCFFHERGGIQFPKDGPCAKSGRCDVLAGITVERIVAAVEAKVA